MAFLSATPEQIVRAKALQLDIKGMSRPEIERAILCKRYQIAHTDVRNKGLKSGSFIALKTGEKVIKVGKVLEVRNCYEIRFMLRRGHDCTFILRVSWKNYPRLKSWCQPFSLHPISEEEYSKFAN